MSESGYWRLVGQTAWMLLTAWVEIPGSIAALPDATVRELPARIGKIVIQLCGPILVPFAPLIFSVAKWHAKRQYIKQVANEIVRQQEVDGNGDRI